MSVIFVHYAVFRYVGYIQLALCRLWCILESRKETDIYKRLFKERIKAMKLNEKMSYSEFKKNYPYSNKHYNIDPIFSFSGIITEEKTHYTRNTDKGRWKETEKETETISAEYYMNIIEATPFFKRCGSEKVYKGYSLIGYIPLEIVSISPCKTEKIVRKFYFTDKTILPE